MFAIALDLINALPAMFSAIQTIKATLSTDDQTVLDAALAQAMKTALPDIAKAEADLKAAGDQ